MVAYIRSREQEDQDGGTSLFISPAIRALYSGSRDSKVVSLDKYLERAGMQGARGEYKPAEEKIDPLEMLRKIPELPDYSPSARSSSLGDYGGMNECRGVGYSAGSRLDYASSAGVSSANGKY